MRIFRNLIFISILGGLFFVIYKQSSEKGFRKLWTSLKIAIYVAAVLSGLISNPAEAIEYDANNNHAYHGKLLHDQNVILVKGDGRGNPSNAPSKIGHQGQSPSGFPTQAGKPSRSIYIPQNRIAPNVVPGPGLDAQPNPAGAGGGDEGGEVDDQCLVPKNQKSQKSKVFEYDYRSNTQKKKKQSAQQCELDDEFKKDGKYGGFDYKLDKNGNPILRVETKTGSEAIITYDKSLEKYHHEDVYNLKRPKGYDAGYAKSLDEKPRIEYIKKTVPREYVIEYQLATARSLSTEKLRKVPGFISANKEPGNLYINEKTYQVHFVNDRTNMWRTTVIKSKPGLMELAKNGFHLFPDAGKKKII